MEDFHLYTNKGSYVAFTQHFVFFLVPFYFPAVRCPFSFYVKTIPASPVLAEEGYLSQKEN